MKRLPFVIVMVVAVLVAVVTGCGGTPRYDGRLTAADSLMRPNPDSALALLEALPADSLATAGDSAYRDLLLTQARYRCYVTATSDSAINRALAYYRAHDGEREKLTRAYIYKGAVMEELGHPDSAMFYYKHAEATVAPDDYFNLGYANMRMGALYRDHYTMDGKHIEKYKEALKYLNHTDNEHYQLVCMINLGSLYCLRSPKNADSILNKALLLAERLNDSENYVGAIQNLIKNDISRNRYVHARGLIQKVMAMDEPKITIPFCLYSAQTYACSQMPDSAQFFMRLIGDAPIGDEMDKIAYIEAKSDIALARGDSTGYLLLRNESKLRSDSLQSLGTSLTVLTAEDEIERQSHQAMQLSQQVYANWSKILTAACVLIMILCVSFFIIRKKRHEKQMKQLMEISESQLNEMKQSMESLQKLNVKEGRLKDLLNSHMNLIRDMMEECYHHPNQIVAQRIISTMRYQKKNKQIWEKLYEYIDMEFNGLITKTKTDYPQLNDKDLLLIAMTSLNFSYIQIALVFGYTNATTISSKKQRLANKMELNGSLNDYIGRFKSPHEKNQ